MIDWSNVKSGRVIEDVDEIAHMLSVEGRVEAEMSGMSVVRDGDDLRIRKRVDFVPPLKEAPTPAEVEAMAKAVGIDFRPEMASRAIPYIASDERADRHGDIVRQQWDFDNFALNPVLCWSHDWGAPPLGNTISWDVIDYRSKDGSYEGPALYLVNLFATEDEWPWADTIYRLVRTGFLKSSSVGFYARSIMYVEDDDERGELGLGRYGVVFERSELVEHSPTTVPANPGAVSLLRGAKAKGLLKAHDIEAIREMSRESIVRGEGDASRFRARDAQWRTVWSGVFPGYKAREHDELDVPIALDAPEGTEDRLMAMIGDVHGKLASLEDRFSAVEEEDRTLASSIDEVKALVEDLTSRADLTDIGMDGARPKDNDHEHRSALCGVIEKGLERLKATDDKLAGITADH